MDYTSAVTIALREAELWAGRLGSDDVLPAHLLLGLLHDEEGRAAEILAIAGTSHQQVRRALLPELPPGHAPHPDFKAAMSPGVQRIMRQAADLARLFAPEGSVASDQVLLALLRHDEPLRSSLEAVGLNFARLEAEIAPSKPPITLEEPLDLGEPREQVDLARILDAAANRAREGLRVLDDYCRFVLDDAFLSAELKRLRHDLTAALGELPPRLLLEARNTLGDVGLTISTPGEQERAHLKNVAQVNMKRLQEALRSLEEFGKLHSPDFGRAIEGLRYRAYTLERALFLGAAARQRLADARLYVLVSEDSCRASLSGTIHEAAAGGVHMVQLREKKLDDRALLERARQMRAWTRKLGVLFIMNDRPDVARLADADGVHLGQDDMSVADARRLLGPDALIGVSTHNLDQLRRAVLEGASYIGVGPVFPSATKNFDRLAGMAYVRQALAETSLPAFVIGGITLETLPEAVAAGARRAAVSHAICQSDNPRRTAAKMREILDRAVR
jgi:thiamine-phosphate pyrophosphorylase